LEIDLTHIEGLFGEVEGFVGEKAIGIAARIVKERIISLSSQGLDAFGTPFPLVQTKKGLQPYSYGYERYKRLHGGETNFRNLAATPSSEFLQSIYLEGNELRFPPEQEGKAEGNIYIKTNTEAIKYWDVSPETIELAEREIQREIEAGLEGWISR
jgi:hypothetical protein